ncbi:MAG: pirin family protein [Spirochaetaceae bacterium]|nr:pirin family protein [Spirochaetaceae bacterium]
MKRNIEKKVKGNKAIDGDNVHLVRVLSKRNYNDFDPILMLDSFDSTNYEDYKNGFPFHPHRGIETISYLSKGKMIHRDTLNNEEIIKDGEVQWMSTASGIMHEEKFPKSNRLLGVQLWLNIPKDNKMDHPSYLNIRDNEIKKIPISGGVLKLISGNYKDYSGYKSKYLPLDFYVINLEKNNKLILETKNDQTVILFSLLGKIKISDEEVDEKTAVKLSNGDYFEIESLDENIELLVLKTQRLNEKIAWAGPIVMNNEKQINEAFKELEEGTFLKNQN